MSVLRRVRSRVRVLDELGAGGLLWGLLWGLLVQLHLEHLKGPQGSQKANCLLQMLLKRAIHSSMYLYVFKQYCHSQPVLMSLKQCFVLFSSFPLLLAFD